MADTVIAERPPDDGREWDCQCARCGSSCGYHRCDACGGDGYQGHDCGEDTCCCLEPEDNVRCDVCDGAGGWSCCLSSDDYCLANPMPGREDVSHEAGVVEWFVVDGRRRA